MRIPRDAGLSLWQLSVSWAVAFVVSVILPLPAHLHLGAQNVGVDQSYCENNPKCICVRPVNGIELSAGIVSLPVFCATDIQLCRCVRKGKKKKGLKWQRWECYTNLFFYNYFYSISQVCVVLEALRTDSAYLMQSALRSWLKPSTHGKWGGRRTLYVQDVPLYAGKFRI